MKVNGIWISNTEIECISPKMLKIGKVNMTININENNIDDVIIFEYIEEMKIFEINPRVGFSLVSDPREVGLFLKAYYNVLNPIL